jgi:hypothetical protein
MARVTHEREDLLRDARALSPRVQLRLRQGGVEAVVFGGFRGDALSLYFGDDPAYHFNSQGELRRAFAGDRLIKAEVGRLIAMRRVRTTTEVELHAEPFSEVDQQQFLDDLGRRLAELKAGLASASVVVEGQVPPDGDAVEHLAIWLARYAAPMPAASPHVT